MAGNIRYFISNPRMAVARVLSMFSPFITDDKIYCKLQYFIRTGRRLNLKTSEAMAEKICWLKIYGDFEALSKYADKLESRKIAAQKVGENHVLPIWGEWDKASDIDFSGLPDNAVLKCNHDSGSTVIFKREECIDTGKIVKHLDKCLKRDFHLLNREWIYSFIPRRIFAEPLHQPFEDGWIREYKWYCFDGNPGFVISTPSRNGAHEHLTVYTPDYHFIDAGVKGRRRERNISKPKNWEEMKEMATKLAADFQFVRIDLYDTPKGVFFGEYTILPAGGNELYYPYSFELEFGEKIKIP